MEMMLTGDSITGVQAAEGGWANKAFPADELDDRVVSIASRIAKIPPQLAQLNKRVVHRQMEVMGIRTGIRIGTELCALGTLQPAMDDFIAAVQRDGLTGALQSRDSAFGDYRTVDATEGAAPERDAGAT
jgi:enoyl-CoA hydratase